MFYAAIFQTDFLHETARPKVVGERAHQHLAFTKSDPVESMCSLPFRLNQGGLLLVDGHPAMFEDLNHMVPNRDQPTATTQGRGLHSGHGQL